MGTGDTDHAPSPLVAALSAPDLVLRDTTPSQLCSSLLGVLFQCLVEPLQLPASSPQAVHEGRQVACNPGPEARHAGQGY